ncbi:MAG: DUF6785 family protein [Armatimonadota bacterium]
MDQLQTQHAPETKVEVKATQEPDRRIRLFPIIIGLLLIPLNVYWVIVSELRWYVVVTLNPLFMTPIFYLFVLVGMNGFLKRFIPRAVLRPGEMVIIYIMLVMSCTIATHDFIINLMTIIPWPEWYATPENHWAGTLFPHLPRWLLVWDRELLEGCFNGNSSFMDPKVLKMWLPPLGFWSIFIFAIGWMFFCMNVLLRKAWTEHTKLTFPIVQLPLAMTNEKSSAEFMKSKALWIGFSLAAILSITNGLHEWFPSVPHFQVRAHWINFTTLPWAAINPLPITFYPFAVGLAFLMPLDVAFSAWFFFLFVKAQAIIGNMAGYSSIPDFPFQSEQGIGAWYAFGIFVLYSSRHNLKAVIKTALAPSDGSDKDEPISYRTALWGLVAGMVIFFLFWWMAGMSPIWVIVVLFTYLLLSITITRVRAESGAQHTVWDLEPKNLFRMFDSRMLGPANLAAAAMSHWYWRLNRSHTMPSQLEAFKLASEHKINLRSLTFPLLAAFVISVIAGMWACLHVFYSEGALAKCQGFGTWTGMETYSWLDNSLKTGFKAQPIRWVFAGSASGIVVLLSILRSKFAWFPLHPLGYCIGPWMIWLWFPTIIAWVTKLLILRYGGLRMYRKALPFFLGLVLGDYVIGAIWSLIGVIWHVPTLQIFH